jgi:hypothetical protein
MALEGRLVEVEGDGKGTKNLSIGFAIFAIWQLASFP